jgi:hypothetical protein
VRVRVCARVVFGEQACAFLIFHPLGEEAKFLAKQLVRRNSFLILDHRKGEKYSGQLLWVPLLISEPGSFSGEKERQRCRIRAGGDGWMDGWMDGLQLFIPPLFFLRGCGAKEETPSHLSGFCLRFVFLSPGFEVAGLGENVSWSRCPCLSLTPDNRIGVFFGVCVLCLFWFKPRHCLGTGCARLGPRAVTLKRIPNPIRIRQGGRPAPHTQYRVCRSERGFAGEQVKVAARMQQGEIRAKFGGRGRG